jgi:hypothetical protein
MEFVAALLARPSASDLRGFSAVSVMDIKYARGSFVTLTCFMSWQTA